jgi:hypothetical protein
MSIIISRVAGVALVSLALAGWFSRNRESQNGLSISLLFYNIASIVLLAHTGLYEHLNGIALWPVVVEHILMATSSAKCLGFTGKLKSLK